MLNAQGLCITCLPYTGPAAAWIASVSLRHIVLWVFLRTSCSANCDQHALLSANGGHLVCHNCTSPLAQLQGSVFYIVQVLEADGLQTILALLPVPYAEPSVSDAAAAPSTVTAPVWANKPQSSRLQTKLLQLFAAIVQSADVRSSMLSPDRRQISMACSSAILNILNPDAPQLPVAAPVAIAPGGKGAVGKADGKAKVAGKGKADAVPAVPAVPPPELLPPFPAAVQLPAVQCLQVSVMHAWSWRFMLHVPHAKLLSGLDWSETVTAPPEVDSKKQFTTGCGDSHVNSLSVA